MRKKLLITGHRGYIGSVMAPLLAQAGYEVVGLDTGYFGECTLIPDSAAIPSIIKDIRDVERRDLEAVTQLFIWRR
jgi:nucleoside-diphosphate-sugar epimerase